MDVFRITFTTFYNSLRSVVHTLNLSIDFCFYQFVHEIQAKLFSYKLNMQTNVQTSTLRASFKSLPISKK